MSPQSVGVGWWARARADAPRPDTKLFEAYEYGNRKL